jgi:hypothetical protein
LTWQVSPKNKLSVYYNIAPRRTEHWTLVSTLQPEASNLQRVTPNHIETATFRSTISPKGTVRGCCRQHDRDLDPRTGR